MKARSTIAHQCCVAVDRKNVLMVDERPGADQVRNFWYGVECALAWALGRDAAAPSTYYKKGEVTP